MIRLPSVTLRAAAASTGLLVEAAAAREWVGGDPSHDTMLTDMILTAQEEVEAYLGIQLGSATVTDLYPAWRAGDRLIASAPYAGAPTVKIKREDGDGADFDLTAIATAYVVDRTGERPAVIPQTPYALWPHAENPVSVAYATSAADSPRLRERISNSILTRVGILFESRGTVPPPGWERAWQSTLPRIWR